MQEAAALWSVGQVSAAGLIGVACELLVRGVDGPTLAMLAGVHRRHADKDVPELPRSRVGRRRAHLLPPG